MASAIIEAIHAIVDELLGITHSLGDCPGIAVASDRQQQRISGQEAKGHEHHQHGAGQLGWRGQRQVPPAAGKADAQPQRNADKRGHDDAPVVSPVGPPQRLFWVAVRRAA